MNRTAAALVEQVEAYACLFDRVSAGGRFEESSSDGPVRLVSDAELLEATVSVTRLIRSAEAERVKVAGEIARRSEVPDEASFAKRMGATNATDLLAQVSGVPREEAGSIVRLAADVRPVKGLAWCDAAHLRPAGYGSTSIDNGLLLCWRCHLLLDQHGWQVRWKHDRWWWTPPPWVDPSGRGRPGGRIPPLDLSA